MSDDGKPERVILHKHLWPDPDCGCWAFLAVLAIAAVVAYRGWPTW